MKSFKLLQIADLHLGKDFPKFPEEKRKQRQEDLNSSLTKAVDLAIDEGAKAVLIPGDLFDAPNVPKKLLNFVQSEFNKLAQSKIPVFIAPGNHDDPFVSPASTFDELSKIPNVHLFNQPAFSHYCITAEGMDVFIYGIAFDARQKDKHILKDLKPLPDKGFHLALIHGSYSPLRETFLADKEEGFHYPLDSEEMTKSGIDYFALGHHHLFKEIDEPVKACYTGSPGGLRFSEKELGERYFALIEVNTNKQIFIKKIAASRRQLSIINVDCTLKDFDKIVNEIRKHKNNNLILKVNLTGTIESPNLIDSSKFIQNLEDDFFHLEIDNSKVNVVPDIIASDNSPKSNFIRKMSTMIEGAVDDQEKLKWRKALEIGITEIEKAEDAV